MTTKRIPLMIGTMLLSTLAERAEAEEATITSALKRLQAGDLEAEALADAAQARLEALVEEMGRVQDAMASGRRATEIASFLAA